MAESKSVIIKIKRQNTPTSKPYWEEFSVPYRPNMNVISALMDVAADPVTRDGKATTPITYDSNCLEEVCQRDRPQLAGRDLFAAVGNRHEAYAQTHGYKVLHHLRGIQFHGDADVVFHYFH